MHSFMRSPRLRNFSEWRDEARTDVSRGHSGPLQASTTSWVARPFDAEVHHVNTSCGDELTLRVKLSADGTIVDDVSYEAEGCSISQASTSVMAEEIVGRPVEEAMAKLAEFERMITSRGQVDGDEEIIGDGVAFSGVSQYPARVKCALLGWKAFQAATADALEDK